MKSLPVLSSTVCPPSVGCGLLLGDEGEEGEGGGAGGYQVEVDDLDQVELYHQLTGAVHCSHCDSETYIVLYIS